LLYDCPNAPNRRSPPIAAKANPVPPPNPAPLLVTGLVKRFGSITAVDNISLELRSGECLGLLGPNGAGKSTLIRSIVGRVSPDAGTISIFGAPAGSPAASAAIGWIPQELALYPRLTAAENLRAFGRYSGLAGKPLLEAVAWCLNWSGLEDRADALVRTLSGGMKRRLNMAAGLIHQPRLVLMDEPTVGVDPQSRNRIFEMIESLRNRGMTIIYTTHYMEEAERLADRIAIVDHGRIIALDTNQALVESCFPASAQVVARFSTQSAALSVWTSTHGGALNDSTAEFALDHPTDLARLLDSAASAGLDLEDLALRRPNLESVFLHLTGRELRD
jgi:ABC-2 type transport system ATP-binding protein